MGDTRFKNGLAYGPYANFASRTDNLFSENDTTPDVTNGNLFFSNNTTNTVITNFDLQAPPGDNSPTYSQGYQGKAIRVVFLDDSTGLANSGRLRLASSDGLQGTNNSIELVYVNSAWVEFGRSYNSTQIITVESKNLTGSILSLGTGAVSVKGGVSVIRIIAAAASNAVIRQAINGAQGQIITLLAVNSEPTIIVNSASNIDGTFCTTSTATGAQFILTQSGAISFIKNGTRWHEIRQVGADDLS